ncbi:MAG TPA: type II toxin-antitoxin system VapB family antitoxin [Reyranella sp.]|nr:type II toxin-antitoxin system VapB family antitoxin [Reyranella sp.]
MTARSTAKIFMHGRSQAVRLPKEFRLPGKEVRVRKVGNGVLLEPIEKKFDFDSWLAKVQALAGHDFLPEGRPEQPPWPADDDDEISFD